MQENTEEQDPNLGVPKTEAEKKIAQMVIDLLAKDKKRQETNKKIQQAYNARLMLGMFDIFWDPRDNPIPEGKTLKWVQQKDPETGDWIADWKLELVDDLEIDEEEEENEGA